MSLHGQEDRDNLAFLYRIAFKVFRPPFAEGFIWAYEEWLLRWWCLGEYVGDVRTKDQQVFGGGHGVEESRTGLINTVCVSFRKY